MVSYPNQRKLIAVQILAIIYVNAINLENSTRYSPMRHVHIGEYLRRLQ